MANLKLPIIIPISFDGNKQQKGSFANAWQWFQVGQELDAVHVSECTGGLGMDNF